MKGLKGNEIGGKMCNAKVQQLLVPCELPHETKDKCMVIYVFGDALALINGHLDKCEFVDILKHQIDVMGSTCVGDITHPTSISFPRFISLC
jgi:hypothetical protein